MTLKGPINTFILVANRNKQKQILNSFKHSGLFEFLFNFLNPNATRTNPDTYHNIYRSFGSQKKCDLQINHVSVLILNEDMDFQSLNNMNKRHTRTNMQMPNKYSETYKKQPTNRRNVLDPHSSPYTKLLFSTVEYVKVSN